MSNTLNDARMPSLEKKLAEKEESRLLAIEKEKAEKVEKKTKKSKK